MPDFTKTILIASGDTDPGVAIQPILAFAADGVPVIGIDGGADNALQMGVYPQVVIGDMDSIQPSTLTLLRHHGSEILQYPPQKDETDLELGLLEAVKRGAEWIRVIGGTGDRLDQTFGNIHLLQIGELVGIDVRFVSSRQTIWVAGPGEHDLMGEIGDTISLLPIREDVEGVTTYDLQYPLVNETLALGPARGMSNVISGDAPKIAIAKGNLLVVHTIGRA